MNYLMDTHTFLWFNSGAMDLSENAKTLIKNQEHQAFISMASLWEISIKNSLSKLDLKDGYAGVLNYIEENNFAILPIRFEHTLIQNALPFHHRDPFDRMIIAQAITENMDIIGMDKEFDNYLTDKSIKRIW